MMMIRHLLAGGVAAWAGVTLASAPVVAAVSIPPQKFVFDAVAGGAATCRVVIDRGQDPHFFEPTPRQLLALRGCRLYFQIGLPFETVLVGKLAAINPGMLVYGETNAVRHSHGGHHHNHAGCGGGCGGEDDPHRWMSPDVLVSHAHDMAVALAGELPEHADGFMARQAEFAARIMKRKAQWAGRLAEANVTHVLVYHPAWGHFADAFGLEQLAVEVHGQTPGARHLASVSADIQEHGLKTMLVQHAAERRRIAAFARRHGLRVVEIHPLGEDVIATLEATVDALCADVNDTRVGGGSE